LVVFVLSSFIVGGWFKNNGVQRNYVFFFLFPIFLCVFFLSFRKTKERRKNNVGLSRSCFNRFQLRNVCHSLNFCFFSSHVLLSHEMMENDRVLILSLCVRVFVFLSLIFVSFSSPACYWLALGPAISILQPIDVLFRSAPSLSILLPLGVIDKWWLRVRV
jgi:hypothetical protein